MLWGKACKLLAIRSTKQDITWSLALSVRILDHHLVFVAWSWHVTLTWMLLQQDASQSPSCFPSTRWRPACKCMAQTAVPACNGSKPWGTDLRNIAPFSHVHDHGLWLSPSMSPQKKYLKILFSASFEHVFLLFYMAWLQLRTKGAAYRWTECHPASSVTERHVTSHKTHLPAQVADLQWSVFIAHGAGAQCHAGLRQLWVVQKGNFAHVPIAQRNAGEDTHA